MNEKRFYYGNWYDPPARSRSWERGDWFISFTGRQLNALEPKPDDIDLRDIAHHLSMVCRYGGACPRFYSVAAHSMYVADLLSEDLKREGLMHDSSEAYLGDMIKAVKVYCPDYRELEEKWERAIQVRFQLRAGVDVKAAVKRADISALLAERRDVFNDPREYLDERSKPGALLCRTSSPEADERAFLAYAERLGLR